MLAQEPVEGGNPEGIKMLKKSEVKNEANILEDPTQLLRSWPESRGLHPVGALARPHKEEIMKKQKRLTSTARSRSRVRSTSA